MGDIFEAFGDDEPTPQRVRSERRRKRRTRATAVIVAALAVLAGLTFAVIPNVQFWISSNPLTDLFGNGAEDYAEGQEGEPVQITIPEGSTGADMASILASADVVASREAFINAFNADAGAGSIQPGTYELPTKIPAQRAVTLLKDHAGQRIDMQITIPEGFTRTQVHERVANIMDVPLDDVVAASENTEAIGLPAEAGGNVEGWYMPQTYMFNPDTPVHEILGEMIAARVAELDALEVPADQRQELLIKASILEREVNQEEYYPMVARVIENRLVDTASVNGRLQMDSTVLYGVGKSGGIPTRAELDDDNPYNSYIYAGLPPTPIGAPGHAAIDGILNPAEGDWLYFVTVDLYTGETLFAATLDEHNANKQKLDQWLAENPDYGSTTAPAQEEAGGDE
ncbi:endolytic transglycosylase MltG [Flaviflexus huanghaiensis]|uniref:endolytic transglycosylase MltG n=1 Tax=Flaviflexus huanghaiensis TaxID=1111473 RepID=UPI0015FAE999|nr:endolytic transglycosylase MltG [Flaviflexus huanghaiensis]